VDEANGTEERRYADACEGCGAAVPLGEKACRYCREKGLTPRSKVEPAPAGSEHGGRGLGFLPDLGAAMAAIAWAASSARPIDRRLGRGRYGGR